MNLRVLIALASFLHLGLGVRLRHDLRSTLRVISRSVNISQASQGPSIKSVCPEAPVKVREDEDGFCQNSGTNADVPFFCCNVLRSCRSNSNTLLNYYDRYLRVYEDQCGVVDADFSLTRDGQRLELIDPSETGKACQPLCLTSRELREKESLEITTSDIVEQCSETVNEEMWKPQLDGAAWPKQKVEELDRSWTACGGQVETTTATTTPIIVTQTTTTVTFTADEPDFEEVDMSWMGGDTVYQGHQKSGFWKWSNRAKRPDVREEILRNHKCADRGSRNQTYYASSLCYWIPDVPTASRTDDSLGVGLEWTGSLTGGDERMCGNFKETGKCVKCNVCHDNARNEAGTVNYNSWVEDIPLGNCRSETQIDQECASAFNLINAPLISAVEVCDEKKARLDSAVALHEQALAMLEALPRLIDVELPLKITTHEDEFNRLRREHNLQQITDDHLMRSNEGLQGQCSDMVLHPLQAGYPIWWRGWEQAWPTSWILGNMTFAVGDRPPRGIPNYDQRIDFWTAVVKCDTARTALQNSYDHTSILAQQKDHTQVLLDATKLELERRREELLAWQQLEPTLKLKREAEEAEWATDGPECIQKMDDLARLRPIRMQQCIPTYYDVSCEKKCLEIQMMRGEGCGIMEGAAPLDPTSRGGVRSVCRPPVASWIKGPTNWLADEESGFQQCRRIYLDGQQIGRHAQRILVRGMLAKKSRWWQWQDRYFILEAGDQVRSAVMRYWYKDPEDDRREPERWEKAIEVWDAQRVEKSGNTCIKLVHFYRTFELCVKDNNSGTRDTWFRHLQDSIKFPDA